MNRELDWSKYSTRLVALKFAYLGQSYNGLEYHPNNTTPLPTVEEKLWKALNKAQLVYATPTPSVQPEEPNWEGCEYSKCGRTDKGVSAFGQVIGVRVRSNRPASQMPAPTSEGEHPEEGIHAIPIPHDQSSDSPIVEPADHASKGEDSVLPSKEMPSFDPISDEISYCQILNRLLPPDIRMLAWCPTPPAGFSARFSCKERQYKYFFTQPAFTPTVGSAYSSSNSTNSTLITTMREGWLDISAMRTAAKKFIGLHDFRNFCKIDTSKQITNFQRRIFHADIEQLDPLQKPLGYVSQPGFSQIPSSSQNPNPSSMPAPSTPTTYAITLHGSAFLWHQVRHMAAILFLIGQGLEPPSLVDDLLDVQKTLSKPQYEMADDAPLVLWDCIFPKEGSSKTEDALEWIYVGDRTGTENKATVRKGGGGKHGLGGLVDEMWKVWRGRKMDEILVGSFLDVIVGQGDRKASDDGNEEAGGGKHKSQKVFHGGDGPRYVGRYIPVLEKPRMESAEVLNAKYVQKKRLQQRRVGVEGEDAADE